MLKKSISVHQQAQMIRRIISRQNAPVFRPVCYNMPIRSFATKKDGDDGEGPKSDQELFEEQAKKKRRSSTKKIAAAAEDASVAEEPPKRKRRTKAEIEAAKIEKEIATSEKSVQTKKKRAA